jgi:hypothetical protein
MANASYHSKAKNLTITLRSVGNKHIVNGEVIRVPGLRAEFNNHVLRTDNEELIKALDKLLHPDHHRYKYWGHKFQKEPSDAVKKEAREMAEKVEAAKRKAVQEVMEKESKTKVEKATAAQGEVTDFKKFLQSRKSKEAPSKPAERIVRGARDVSVL